MGKEIGIEEAKSRIVAEIQRFGDVSFAGIMQIGAWTHGDIQWELGESNVVLWAGMSDALVAALQALRDENAINLVPCSSLVYVIDGALLQLPLAKRIPKRGYAEPHWAPCVLKSAHPRKVSK